MPETQTPLKIDEIAPRFSLLLREAGTSFDAPTLESTWRAFAQFCRETIDCDDERLFFEADLSSAQPDSFYVHFARTCYGREPKGYAWSHDVICDFVFPLDEALEEFNCTFEAEELVEDAAEREYFLSQVRDQEALWQTLLGRQPTQAQIYIGES
jgi:hypothetical protein